MTRAVLWTGPVYSISFGPIGPQRPFTNDYPAENALVTLK
jgi:hypothetical protein